MPNPFGLGAVKRIPDTRDYNLALAGAPSVIPIVFMPDYSPLPVKMQGKFGTCGGHAGGAMESLLENTDLSPKYLWKQIKKIDGYPLDAGTDMRSIFKALQSEGTCHEALCGDYLDPTIEEYSDPKTITVEQQNDSYTHGITNYAFTNYPSWQQIKEAIYHNKVVIAHLDCGDGWWTPSWKEQDILPLKMGTFASGHFVVLWGYDEKYIYFRNSWSKDWGRNGDGYFDISYLPHVVEIGAGIDSVTIKQRLVTLYTKLVELLQQIISSLKSK